MDESGFISAFGGSSNGAVDTSMNPWIAAASTVLSKATPGAPAGPSYAGPARSDSGATWLQFGDSPFVVTTGSGDASATGAASPIVWILVAVAVGAVAWKLYKKQ